jgi:GntR family transcriptional regulator
MPGQRKPLKVRQAPKYLVIAEALRARVWAVPPGTRLPPERALTAEFGVSSMTVRQALDHLERDGLVDRIPRKGTFVRNGTITKSPQLLSFTEEMAARGLRTSTRLLGFEQLRVPVTVAKALAIQDGGEAFAIERLRFAEDVPVCLELAHVPVRVASLLTAGDLETSLHAALRRVGHPPTSGHRTVRAVALAPREAFLLGLPDQSPALEITHLFRDPGKLPVEHARSLYRPSRYEVAFEMHRDEVDVDTTARTHRRPSQRSRSWHVTERTHKP